jgi:hypothetical protein
MGHHREIALDSQENAGPLSVYDSLSIEFSGHGRLLGGSDGRLHVAGLCLRNEIGTFALFGRDALTALPLRFASLIQMISGYPQSDGGKGEDDSEASDKFVLILLQEVPQLSGASIGESEERATKGGAVILFTAIGGCALVYWLARRKPRNRTFKNQPKSKEN